MPLLHKKSVVLMNWDLVTLKVPCNGCIAKGLEVRGF